MEREREGYEIGVVVERRQPDRVQLSGYISKINLPLVMLVSTVKYEEEEVWKTLVERFPEIDREKSVWMRNKG